LVREAGGAAAIAGAEIAFHINQPDRKTTAAARTIANEQGQFEFDLEQLPAGRIDVVITAAGYATTVEPIAEARSPRRGGERIFELGKAELLNGRVVDRAGNPVPGVRIGRLFRTEMPSPLGGDPYATFPEVETSETGTFELVGIPASDFTILGGFKRGFKPLFSPAYAPGTRNVELVIDAGEAAVSGSVLSAEGEPLAGVAVRAMARSGGPGFRMPGAEFPDPTLQYTVSNEEGFYEFAGLSAGWITLIADQANPDRESAGMSSLFVVGDEKTINLRFRPPFEVTGKVVDRETNRPIAGVAVVKPGTRMPAPQDPVGGFDVVVTNSEGVFQVSTKAVEDNGIWTVAPLMYRLPADFGHDSEVWRDSPLNYAAVEAGREVVIEVARTVIIEGIVTAGEDGRPAAGVGVDFYRLRGPREGIGGLPSRDPSAAESITGLDGRFRVKAARGATGVVFARNLEANAWAPVSVPEQPESDTMSVSLVLRPVVSISGRVTGPDGSGLANVEIEFLPQFGGGGGGGWQGGGGGGDAAANNPFGGGFGRGGGGGDFNMNTLLAIRQTLYGEGRTFTDADGYYKREGLSPDPVRVQPRRLADSSLIAPQGMNVMPVANTEEINFQFTAGDVLEGLVVDLESQPISGAQVTANRGGQWGGGGPGGWLTRPETQTDAAGRFSIVIPSEWEGFRLAVSHPNFETRDLNDLYADDGPLTIVLDNRPGVLLTAFSGQRQVTLYEYEFVLQAGEAGWNRRNRVTGRALDLTEPVREALSPGAYQVHVYELGADQRRSGGYGYAEFSLAEFEPGQKAAEVRVEVGTAITLRGTVVQRTGSGEEAVDTPMVDARVTLRQQSEPGAGWGGRGGGGGQNATQTVQSGSNGEFEFRFVRPGTVRLEAAQRNFSQLEDVEVRVEAGTELEPVTIVLVNSGRVVARVSGVDDSVLGEMRVHLNRIQGNGARLNNEGVAEFNNISPGEQTVILSSRGGVVDRKSVTVPPGEAAEAEFNLAGRVMLTGRFIRNGAQSNEPRLEFRLNPTAGTETPRAELIARGGEFTQLVYPGTYVVAVSTAGGWTTTETIVEVKDRPFEQSIDVAVELASIGIVILTPPGDFQPGTMTLIRSNDQGGTSSRRVRATRARFFLDNELPGVYTAEFRDRDGQLYIAEALAVEPNGENILTLIPDDNPPSPGDDGEGREGEGGRERRGDRGGAPGGGAGPS
jgi:hypothetical protein